MMPFCSAAPTPCSPFSPVTAAQAGARALRRVEASAIRSYADPLLAQAVPDRPLLHPLPLRHQAGRHRAGVRRQEAGYNVVDVNYWFCNVACSQFGELHRTAGGATLMAHCSWERERNAVGSLDGMVSKLSRIVVEYDDVLPFSGVKQMEPDAHVSGWMEELARELVALSRSEKRDSDAMD